MRGDNISIAITLLAKTTKAYVRGIALVSQSS